MATGRARARPWLTVLAQRGGGGRAGTTERSWPAAGLAGAHGHGAAAMAARARQDAHAALNISVRPPYLYHLYLFAFQISLY
jgi:hypothetical protein